MVLQQKFTREQESPIATYNYTDVAEGTGIITFYAAANTVSGGVIDYFLTTDSTLRSDPITGTAASYDFDLSAFNLPRTIKGTGVITGSFCVESESGNAGVYASGSITVSVIKYDGSTETVIGTAYSNEIKQQGGTVGASTTEHYCLPLSLTKTHFKKGEILRVSIDMNKSGTYGGESFKWHIGHDPADRDEDEMTDNTITKVNIPFDLDL